MEREGNLNVLKLGNQFHVTFTRSDGPGGTASPCIVEGRAALAELLDKKLHIWPATAREVLRKLEKNISVHVQNVRLSDEVRFELGLVSPGEGLSREDIQVNDKVRVKEKGPELGPVVFLTPSPELTVVKIESKDGEDTAWCEWKDGNET